MLAARHAGFDPTYLPVDAAGPRTFAVIAFARRQERRSPEITRESFEESPSLARRRRYTGWAAARRARAAER
jgi:maltooligosyltrehalose synthase